MNNPFNDNNLAMKGLFHQTYTNINNTPIARTTLTQALASLENKPDIDEETKFLQTVSLEDLQIACKNTPELASTLITSPLFNLSLANIDRSISFFDRLQSASTPILRALNLTHLKEVSDAVPLSQTTLWYAICSDTELSNTHLKDLDAYEARFKQLSLIYSKDQDHPNFTKAKAQKELFWKTIEDRLFVLKIYPNEFPSQDSPQMKIKDILIATHKDLERISSQLTVSAFRLIKNEVISQLNLLLFEPNEDEDDNVNCERQQEVFQYLKMRCEVPNKETWQFPLAIPSPIFKNTEKNPYKKAENHDQNSMSNLSKPELFEDWEILERPSKEKPNAQNNQTKELLTPPPNQNQHQANDYTSFGSISSVDFSLENSLICDQPSLEKLIQQYQSHFYTDHFFKSFNIAETNQEVINQLFHQWKFLGDSNFIPVKHAGEIHYEFVWSSLETTEIKILSPDKETTYSVQITNGRGFIKKHLVDTTFKEALHRLSLVPAGIRSAVENRFTLAPELNNQVLERKT